MGLEQRVRVVGLGDGVASASLQRIANLGAGLAANGSEGHAPAPVAGSSQMLQSIVSSTVEDAATCAIPYSSTSSGPYARTEAVYFNGDLISCSAGPGNLLLCSREICESLRTEEGNVISYQQRDCGID